ncbi:MAG: HAMP domain-containing histidine kinase [Rhodocyclaceae bacterium]|jgi:signal transduction histidine kinase|nr:HAMP domain-containing histidine kinase [Rhodocyclaceae bacterium]
MIRLADLSLRWKIPLRVMAAVMGTAIAVTTALVAREYDELRQNLEGHARSLGKVLANTLVAPVLHDDVWRAYEILQSARESNPPSPELQANIVLVTDASYRVFVSTTPRKFPIGSSPAELGGAYAELRARISHHSALEQQIIEPSGSSLYFVMSPLVADGVILGHVILGYSKTSFLPRFLGLVGRAMLVTLIVLVVIMPVSWVWARSTGAPLLALAEAMRYVPDRLDETTRLALPDNQDEIGQLGQAFSRMIAELRKKQELEAQMLASERLAAVGRLSAGIAHEINNPLGGMLTAIKTWQRHGNDDALANQTMARLERGLQQIRNTVAALLVETKTQDRPLEPADIEDVLILVEAQAQSRSVTITLAGGLADELPLPATLVRQILLNLLLNAIAAADEQGHVKLEIAASDGMLRLAVCNDGQHIPDEQMTYLFEPFATGRAQGHGLGLWVVYQIVRQLNGGLTVDSEPGCTSFHIEIPYAQGQ